MTLGTCKLCLQTDVELRSSHFIPAGIYRQLRDPDMKNPNPWEISSTGSVQTSKQLTAHLLCDGCETRLSARGEDWVMKHFLKRNGDFRLGDILASAQPAAHADGQDTKVYLAAHIPEINVDALTYFAASVFWRGSIHPWDRGRIAPVPLGPYAEPLRRYLRDEAGFPEHISLLLAVREGKEISRLTATPMGERKGTVRVYKFPMPGLALAMAVGRGLDAKMQQFCFVRGIGNPIAMTSLLEPLIERDAVKYLQGHIAKEI